MDDLDALWAKLLKDGRAEWRPGMLTQEHGRITGTGLWLVHEDEDETGPWVDCTDAVSEWPEARPDWTDPATLGALCGLVEERWGAFDAGVMWTNTRGWTVYIIGHESNEQGRCGLGMFSSLESKAHALLKALEGVTRD